MYSIIEDMRRLMLRYQELSYQFRQSGDQVGEYQLDTMVTQMKSKLDELSLCTFSSSHQRNSMLSLLNELRTELGGLLADSIWKVREKVYSCNRDRFIMFCQNHDVKGDVSGYCLGLDFTRNIRFGEVSAGQKLYQWCFWKEDGNIVVGQWFTIRKVKPESLGVSPFIDVLGPRGGFHGTGTRVLCSFEMPFTKDCVISRSATIYDKWSVNRYFDGESIDWDGLLSKGGAEQYFVPLTDNEREALKAVANLKEQWAG